MGWNIFGLIYVDKIGFNLFSKDKYIIKLVFSIILLIHSVNYKRIILKCTDKHNKNKDYYLFMWIFLMILLLTLFLIIIALNDISNYSETYAKCCINHISSNKVFIICVYKIYSVLF